MRTPAPRAMLPGESGLANTPSGAQAVPRAADNRSTMQSNVDYRLLERFRAKQHLNMQPTAPQPDSQKRVAAAASGQRLPAIELRD